MKNNVILFLVGSVVMIGVGFTVLNSYPPSQGQVYASESKQVEPPAVISTTFYLEGTLEDIQSQSIALTPIMSNQQREKEVTSGLRPQVVEELCVQEKNRTGSHVLVSPTTFRQAIFTDADQFSFLPGWGYVYSKNPTKNVQLIAPVELPDGATLTQFTVIYLDNFSETNSQLLTVGMFRKNIANLAANNGQAEEMVVLNSGNSKTETKIYCAFSEEENPFTGKTAFVSSDYTYYIVAIFAAGAELNQRLYGVRIDYQP